MNPSSEPFIAGHIAVPIHGPTRTAAAYADNKPAAGDIVTLVAIVIATAAWHQGRIT